MIKTMINELMMKAQQNFNKANLTDSPHRALFEAANNLNIEITIDGKKAKQWDKKTESRYFEYGDEFLKICLLTKPVQRFKVWWKDDRKIVKCK